MPTYGARGVTATLHVTNLAKTVSSSLEGLMKGGAIENARQARSVLTTGDRLFERPIGADGSEKGVARWIGEFDEFPFVMVETGEHIVHISEKYAIAPSIEAPHQEPPVPELAEDDWRTIASSPLTSLGNTPSFGTPEDSFIEKSGQDENAIPLRHDSFIQHIANQKPPPAPVPRLLADFNPKQYHREPAGGPQALSLSVEVGSSTYEKGKDIKMEIFLNGSLVGSEYVNTKRHSLLSQSHTELFHGTRLHIQIEKPWIYRAADQVSQSHLTAEERWAAMAAPLLEEANRRKYDAKGRPTLTAEYLIALSTLALPDRLKDMAQASVIDVVVTTGRGQKFGTHSYPFVTGPLRLCASKFQDQEDLAAQEEMAVGEEPTSDAEKPEDITTQDDDLPDDITQQQNVAPMSSKMEDEQPAEKMEIKISSSDPAPEIPFTSPDIPLARRTRSFQVSRPGTPQPENVPPVTQDPKLAIEREASTSDNKPSTTRSRVDALAKELGLTPDQTQHITTFKTRRGRDSTPRSVNDRLLDILKMLSVNQERAKKELLTQLVSEGILSKQKVSIEVTGLSPTKTPKKGPQASSSGTRRRQMTRSQTVPHINDTPMPDVNDDPVAALAQARMDTAMDFGAPPNGHLAKRIESLSPHRSPVKRLGATSFGSSVRDDATQDSGSQVNVSRNVSPSPTKLRRGRSRLAEASDASGKMLTSDEIAVHPSEPQVVMKSSSKAEGGSKKSAQSGIGTTQEEALRAFEIPEICQGGSVSYADAGVHRCIVKSRPGEFIEEELVVGMRFVVL